MRYKYLAPLIWIVLSVSYLVGQNDVALLRGNAARTGEFAVSGVNSFGSVLWKSELMFNKTELPLFRHEVNVRGTKGEFETPMPQWNNPIRSFPGDSIGFLIPPKYLQESAPLIYEKSIFYSLNFEEGFVVSLDVKTGKSNWIFRHFDPGSRQASQASCKTFNALTTAIWNQQQDGFDENKQGRKDEQHT